ARAGGRGGWGGWGVGWGDAAGPGGRGAAEEPGQPSGVRAPQRAGALAPRLGGDARADDGGLRRPRVQQRRGPARGRGAVTVRGVGKTSSENAIRRMFGLIAAGIIGVVALLLAMRADLSVLKRDNAQNRADVVEIKAKLDAVTSSQYPR